MADERPLRPELYERLRQRFGRVKIANAGVQANPGYRRNERTGKTYLYFDKTKGHYPGEHYRVNCPMCGDAKFRLYINHLWNKAGLKYDGYNLNLAHCMHENCYDALDQQLVLREMVFGWSAPGSDVVLQGRRAERSPDGGPPMPGRVIRMDSVPPTWDAYRYLQGRRYDPAWLGRYLGVGYLGEETAPRFGYCRNRIFIPIFLQGKMVGWQCRSIGEPPDKKTPKYLTGEGTARACLLYNFDNARHHKWVCVQEGATKVWRFGPEAVATMGKVWTGFQADLLVANWEVIVAMLDADAQRENSELVGQLQARGRKVVCVQLAEGQDPDEMPTAVVRGLAASAARAAGIALEGLT
jgi:hypothetical protein